MAYLDKDLNEAHVMLPHISFKLGHSKSRWKQGLTVISGVKGMYYSSSREVKSNSPDRGVLQHGEKTINQKQNGQKS